MLRAAESAYREQLDPEIRSSLLSKSLREFQLLAGVVLHAAWTSTRWGASAADW